MNRGLDIKIGGEAFRILFENRNKRIFGLVEKELRDYISSDIGESCDIRIIPCKHNRVFTWKPLELKRFRDYFKILNHRFPPSLRAEKRVNLSLRILQYLDPEDENVRHIRSLINKTEAFVYARVGSDQFFFDTESKVVFCFIKESVFPDIFAEIFYKLKLRSPRIVRGALNGIMLSLSHLLIQNNGLLLHGAALQKDGKAFLFLGLSGSGKSTVSRLCSPDICFSDDGTIIRKEGDNVYAYSSPFRQNISDSRYPASFKGKINKIFLLEKKTRTRVIPMKKNELMNNMLAQMIHFFKYLNRDSACAGFFLVKEILDIIPCYKLEFAKNSKIWDYIAQ